MADFSRSTTGRLMALSVGIALVGGGASALMSGSEALLVQSVSLFLPIVINIFALPDALEEHWGAAIAAVIGLPVLLWLYAIGLATSHVYLPGVGYAFVVLGLGALAMATRSRPAARAAASEGSAQMARQH